MSIVHCWARGCHAGRPGDEGFPIPHMVPAVIGSPASLVGFGGPSDLAAYLHEAHPPQRPGALAPEDCGPWQRSSWRPMDGERRYRRTDGRSPHWRSALLFSPLLWLAARPPISAA